ncbi:hypothetical protein Tco_0221402 [Tanacetum coccineum]
MSTLQFADTHNLVAFLAKPAESEGFEQVVDFLNAHTIKYALTVNPTIYTSCIEQFWATIKVKMVNGEQQLQALVDGKKIVVTEASVRGDLQLDDEEGTDFLPNATIFEELTRMGYEKLLQKLIFYKAFFSPQWKFLIHTILQCLSAKTTVWNEFSSTMVSAIICLATNQKFNFSKYIFESMVKNLDNAGKFLMYPRFIQVFLYNQLEGMSSHKRIYVIPSYTKNIFANMRRQGKDFSGRETPLFPTMVVQTQEEMGEGSAMQTNPPQTPIITQPSSSQPQRKKNLGGLRRRTLRVGRSTRIVSSDEASLGDQEDASKQGRKIHDIDADEDITIENVHDAKMFDVNDLDGDEVVVKSEVTDKAGKKRNIVEEAVAVTDVVTIPVSAATITNVELTLAQTLAELKSARPKTKGVAMQEPSESTPTISLQLPSQVKGQCSKDKGKAKMIEPEKPLKKKDQIKFDEEDRLTREKPQQRVNTFVDFRTELVEGTEMEESSKKAEVMEESSKRIEGKEVAVDAIHLATKPPSIRRLETLWKLVKAKHGYTRPEECYERVLWGDLKTMFEHHIEDAVWRNLQESKVLVWKLFDSGGVHFVRFQNLHVFMLVEKRYPLTPATIIDMLNKKLQADHWRNVLSAS